MPEKKFATEEEVFLYYCNLTSLSPSAEMRGLWLAGRASIREVSDNFVWEKSRKIQELEKELALAQDLANSFSTTKSLCGHLQVYLYFPIGEGKEVCTVCEMTRLKKRVDELEKQNSSGFE